MGVGAHGPFTAQLAAPLVGSWRPHGWPFSRTSGRHQRVTRVSSARHQGFITAEAQLYYRPRQVCSQSRGGEGGARPVHGPSGSAAQRVGGRAEAEARPTRFCWLLRTMARLRRWSRASSTVLGSRESASWTSSVSTRMSSKRRPERRKRSAQRSGSPERRPSGHPPQGGHSAPGADYSGRTVAGQLLANLGAVHGATLPP